MFLSKAAYLRRGFDFEKLWVVFDDVQQDCVDVALEAPALIVFFLVGFLELWSKLKERKKRQVEFESLKN